jgi:CDP-diacylglycerol--serine O-phosphatidyltransferase
VEKNSPEQPNSDPQISDMPSSSASIDSFIPVDDYEEIVSVDGKKQKMRGIYLLPNLFTTGALFSGFYALIAGMQAHYEVAAIAIFVAMFLDILDGRVARLANAQSAFGAEYDSLSDMVSFGVAPAVVVYSWSLSSLGKFGWTAAFIYVAGAALRLARFNTQAASADKRYFTGLASPAAASLVACMVWLSNDMGLVGSQLPKWLPVVASVVTIVAGLLMVSNFRYQSFKVVDVRKRVPFIVVILMIVLFSVVHIDPPFVLLAMLIIYALSGPVMGLWDYFAKSKKDFS